MFIHTFRPIYRLKKMKNLKNRLIINSNIDVVVENFERLTNAFILNVWLVESY